MKIESLQELNKLLSLCRKQGVTSIIVDGIEITLGFDSKEYSSKKLKQKQLVTDDFSELDPGKIETPDELTEDQLLMWSTGEHQ